MQAHVCLLHEEGRTVLGDLGEKKPTIEQVFMRQQPTCAWYMSASSSHSNSQLPVSSRLVARMGR